MELENRSTKETNKWQDLLTGISKLTRIGIHQQIKCKKNVLIHYQEADCIMLGYKI